MHTNAYEALECIRNAYKYNRYYSLPGNGNDSIERRDMLVYIDDEEFELSEKNVRDIKRFYQEFLRSVDSL